MNAQHEVTPKNINKLYIFINNKINNIFNIYWLNEISNWKLWDRCD